MERTKSTESSTRSIFKQQSTYIILLFGLAVIAYILVSRWPQTPVPYHLPLNLRERVKIDTATVCCPESLSTILHDILRNEREQNAALDSIASSRSQQERLLDAANDRFSDVIGLMEVVLGAAGLLALIVAWQGKKAIDRFDDKVREIEGARKAAHETAQGLEDLVTNATSLIAKIESMEQTARTHADSIATKLSGLASIDRYSDLAIARLASIEEKARTKAKELSSGIETKDAEEKAMRIKDMERQWEIVESLGGKPTADELDRRAWAYFNAEHIPEAIRDIEAAIDLDKPNNDLKQKRAVFLWLDDRGEEAIRQIDELMNQEDKSLEVQLWRLRAVIQADLENKPEAAKSLKRARELGTDDSFWQDEDSPIHKYVSDPDFRALVGLPPLDESGSPK